MTRRLDRPLFMLKDKASKAAGSICFGGKN
jgi:hypothetical protein